MIKVIASDMDGTLLGDDHMVAPETAEAIKKACSAGIRFMIATGRNFRGTMEALQGVELKCDYIVGSGAEVRNPEKQVVKRIPMSLEDCKRTYEIAGKYPVSVIFCTDEYDYQIGTREQVEKGMIQHIQLFHLNMTEEEILASPIFERIKKNTKTADSVEELYEKQIPVYKVFISSGDQQALKEMKEHLEKNDHIAVASSFATNLEITDVRAQKGPVLKEYIEKLGYTMDQVMVLGDSLNDYSMLSMDFGAAVAMENAMEEVKQVSRYITKSNADLGVAYAIEMAMEGCLQQLAKK